MKCEAKSWFSNFPVRQYYIVNHGGKAINFAATESSVLRGLHDYTKDMRPDLFMYRNRPHVAMWYGGALRQGHIEVFGDYENYCYIDYSDVKVNKKVEYEH